MIVVINYILHIIVSLNLISRAFEKLHLRYCMGLPPRCFLLGVTTLLLVSWAPAPAPVWGPCHPILLIPHLQQHQRIISALCWKWQGGRAKRGRGADEPFLSSALSVLTHPTLSLCWNHLQKKAGGNQGGLKVRERGNVRTREGHGHLYSSWDLSKRGEGLGWPVLLLSL